MEEHPVANGFYTTIVALMFFTVIFGVIYPFAVTFILQTFFPYQANGSLIVFQDKVKGSELIGQSFYDAKYFWGRPSGTKEQPYNALSSGGTNLATSNPQLIKNIQERIELFQGSENGQDKIPIDLVSGSGSGLDPHISVAGAYYQVPRIAKARAVAESVIQGIVQSTVEERQLGILGEPRVNVVKLNIKLEENAKT